MAHGWRFKLYWRTHSSGVFHCYEREGYIWASLCGLVLITLEEREMAEKNRWLPTVEYDPAGATGSIVLITTTIHGQPDHTYLDISEAVAFQLELATAIQEATNRKEKSSE